MEKRITRDHKGARLSLTYGRGEAAPDSGPAVTTERSVADYDEPTVVAVIAALRSCPPDKQINSLAVAIKVFVEVMCRG